MGFLKHSSDDGQASSVEAPGPQMPPAAPAPPGAAGAAPVGYARGATEGLTEHGRARLELSRDGLFTSDLSVDEFVMVDAAGFEPLGLVMGSSIYHIGYQTTGYNVSQELQVLTQAMYNARQLAMTRMEEEADQLGADGVVGVRLDIGSYEWGEEMAEFQAVGTAVRHREGVLHRRRTVARSKRPVQVRN